MDDREIRRILRAFENRFSLLEKSLGKLLGKLYTPEDWVPCLIKVYDRYSIAGGSGGKYTVLIMKWPGTTCTAKLSGNLAMPEGLVAPTVDEQALGLNLAEDGKSGHWIDTTG